MNGQRLAKYCLIAFPYFVCFYLIHLIWPSSFSSTINMKSFYIPRSPFDHRQDSLKPFEQAPKPGDPVWQPVNGSRAAFAVYTAYSLLNRPNPHVLIIGIKDKTLKDKIYCQFHYPDRDTNMSKRIPGTIDQLLVGSRTYEPVIGVLIRCPLLRSVSTKPEMVSILVNQETRASNKIVIRYLRESRNDPYSYQFSVCVKPTFDYNKVLPLLEWIEFYKMMGVEQFTLYNLTIGPEASCVLNDLMNGGDPSIKMNVLPWRNHHLLNQSIISEQNNVHQSTIAAAQNDCLYRHRGHQSKHMVFVDLDEFIMARGDKVLDYEKLIQKLDSQDREKKFGEYLFKNGFLILDRPDDPTLDQRCSTYLQGSLKYNVCHSSHLMRKVIVEDFHRHRTRSKYIIIPEAVVETATHHVQEFERGFTSLHVPEEIAFSRHYRHFKRKGNSSQNVRIPMSFGLELVEKLSVRAESLMRSCNLELNFDEQNNKAS